MGKSKVLDIRFPAGGVVRRLGYRDAPDRTKPYPTPWTINCRPEDPIARRRRGGSRPGLTKYVETDLGTDVADIISIPVSSASGASVKLAVVADGQLGTVVNGVLSHPVGELATDAGVALYTDEGVQILVDTGTVPANCFLAARSEQVYAITSTAVTVLDATTGVVDTLTATEGSIPTGCTFGCVYRDRLVLAGGDNTIYMSRQGDFTDWDYGADVEDAGRAVAIQLSHAGEIGETVTALMPHNDAYLLAGTANGLWVVQGDPAASGTLRNASRHVGIIGNRALAKVGDSVVFLARDGVYSVQADGSGLTPLSGDKLPEDLSNITAVASTVIMGYSREEKGVYLFLVPGPESGEHWFFDFATQSFWPTVYQADHQPVAACQHEADLLIAGADGYVRTIGGYTDDGTAVTSHLLLGPFRLGAMGSYGRIANLHGALSEESGDVTWRIVTGDTAEEAVENADFAITLYYLGQSYSSYVAASGTFSAGVSHTQYPRVRAVWAVVWLQSTAQWAYESLTLEAGQSGRWR